MEMSKYLGAFSQLDKKTYQLVGDCLLVELIKDEEMKTKGGIILATDMSKGQNNGLGSDRPTFVRVLLTGEGFYNDDTMEPVSLDSKPGDIVLVGTTSIKKFSVFGSLVTHGDVGLGLIRESDIQMRFLGQDGFDSFFHTLNTQLKKAS